MKYSDLKTASKQWADRSDAEVDINLNRMIEFVEATINRRVKVSENSQRTVLITQTSDLERGYYRLPKDFNGMRILRKNGVPIFYRTPEQAFSSSLDVYSILADQLYMTVANEGDCIEIIYYQKVTPLSESNEENWISESHADVYLHGILWYMEDFVKNYEIAKGWRDKMMAAIADIEHSDQQTRWSGSTLQVVAE